MTPYIELTKPVSYRRGVPDPAWDHLTLMDSKVMTYKVIFPILLIISLIIYVFFYSPHTQPPALIEKLILEKKLTEIDDNLSGLTWDNASGSLMAVTNRPAIAINLSEQGQVLHQIPLKAMEDTESIAFIGNNRFLIAEERRRTITPVALNVQQKQYTPLAPRLLFDLGGKRNNGIEGVAYSMQHDTLFIANEKSPAAIYRVDGFLQNRRQGFEIKKIFSSIKDISGLAWCDARQRLYVLSDEAKTVKEIDNNGTIFRESNLSRYIKDLPQPEGIAVHADKLYIVSEPNLFYVLQMSPKMP